MRSTHLPRKLVILVAFLLGLTFLVGNILAFSSVRAAASATPTVTSTRLATGTGTITPDLSPTPEPTPILQSADTTGILIMGILVVSVILIGLIWGNRIRRKNALR